MVWILRKIFWFALFLVATFGFVVLFEHGTQNYPESAQAEFQKWKKLVNTKVTRPKDQSDKVGQ